MTSPVLTLYGSPQCHLCDEMQAALRPWQTRLGFSLVHVAIESDPKLEKRFRKKIPCLHFEGREICHYHLDETALQECLG